MPSQKPTFEEVAALLTKLGIEYSVETEYRGKPGVDRGPHDLKLIHSVNLKFTPAEWCSAAMSEEHWYIGPCCGTTSEAQDVFNHAFRMGGGWFSMKELKELADLLGNHDEIEGEFNFVDDVVNLDEAVERASTTWSRRNPWEKLALVWHIAKHHYTPEVPHAYRRDLPEIESACSIVGNGLHALSLERFFDGHPAMEGASAQSQRKANRALCLARILPALVTVFNRIRDLDLGPLDGFAVIEKEKGPDAVASNGRGLCIFETQEQVDEMFALWRQSQAEYKEERPHIKPIDETHTVRRVRVSMDKGLEFLDDPPA